MKYTFGFIGCGNMGGALVRAVNKTVASDKIAVADYCQDKVISLQNTLGVTPATATEIAQESKFVVLGVKPQNIPDTLAGLADILQARTDAVIVSMAVSTNIAKIRSLIGAELPVIRIMPNTPVAVGAGMVLYDTQGVCEADERAFLDGFSKAGKLDKLSEDKIDSASALSGCGPAFVYAFAEALADGAVECGVPRDKAILYTAQTLLGSAEMLLEHGHPADLKDAVCSPGGTTIAGMHALENGGMRGAVMDAVLSAYNRALELKK